MLTVGTGEDPVRVQDSWPDRVRSGRTGPFEDGRRDGCLDIAEELRRTAKRAITAREKKSSNIRRHRHVSQRAS